MESANQQEDESSVFLKPSLGSENIEQVTEMVGPIFPFLISLLFVFVFYVYVNKYIPM